jgi:SAM-dependent methyltransferase
MTGRSTPYDEFPYRSFPIEWTAPERLALASLLHGGPRVPLEGYRVLELGCGDGTNLISLASDRPQGEFVGIDSARTRIAVADEKRSTLRLTNVSFVACDFGEAADAVLGPFDFIIAHGVFSWVAPEMQAAILRLCADRLRQGGLLYLNYNAKPGWNVRGLVRDFLVSQTAAIAGLRARTDRAREVALRMAEELQGGDHPYSQLLAREFRLVGELDESMTAHDYLSEYNEVYTRREFLDLVRRYGFTYVADADFNYPSGRLPEALLARLAILEISDDATVATADLLCYRQLHSPILTSPDFERRLPDVTEWSALIVASSLVEQESPNREVYLFVHPTGYEVEARTDQKVQALRRLQPLWPSGLPTGGLFASVEEVIDDLKLLQRNGLIEIRVVDEKNT